MSERISVSMPEPMLEELDRVAEEQFMNRSEFIRYAARKRVEEGE